MYLQQIGPKERLEALAEEKHWGIRDLGYKEVPTIPKFVDGFWEEPFSDSNTNRMAVKRLRAIQAAQIPMKGYFIRHETTRQLTAPVKTKKAFPWKPVMVAAVAAVAVTGIAVGLLAALVVALVGVVAMAVLVPSAMFMGVLAAACIDPALVVVLASGEALEVGRWLT